MQGVPPGMSFADMLLGSWDGFDTRSELFHPNAPILATPTPCITMATFGSNPHVVDISTLLA